MSNFGYCAYLTTISESAAFTLANSRLSVGFANVDRVCMKAMENYVEWIQGIACATYRCRLKSMRVGLCTKSIDRGKGLSIQILDH